MSQQTWRMLEAVVSLTQRVLMLIVSQSGLAYPTRDPESRPAQLRHSLGRDTHSFICRRSSKTSLLICLVNQGLLAFDPLSLHPELHQLRPAFRLHRNNNRAVNPPFKYAHPQTRYPRFHWQTAHITLMQLPACALSAAPCL